MIPNRNRFEGIGPAVMSGRELSYPENLELLG
jgi:hypothetical protein